MGRLGSRIPSHVQKVVSDEDDLSDVTIYEQRKSPAAITEYVLLDVSDGPKTVTTLGGVGNKVNSTAGDSRRLGPVTIDGNSIAEFPATGVDWAYQNDAPSGCTFIPPVPLRYDSGLKVEWEHSGTGNIARTFAFILGSGPHSIAVVRDGEPVYMTAKNLSEEAIEGMNVPNGYKIVRNPGITHEEPQTRGMWDDSKEEVVDHPFEKPFHETLDKLSQKAKRTSVQDVIDEIDKNPTAYDNVFEGELPRENPVEEAVQFWKEREEKRTSKLDLSDIR